MNDAASPDETVPAQPAPARTILRSAIVVALALAIAAFALGLWQWYETRAQTESLRQELAKKLAEGEVRNRESHVLAEQVREASREAQVKIGVLESKLADSQNQQIALEALYQDLSRNRDEWAYAEIEQSLLIASQQLQLAGNVRAALIALENADARLQRMERPQLTALRKAINYDTARLKALPYVDTVGISVKLDNVIAAVDTLPLATDARPSPEAAAGAQGDAPGNAWARFWREAWDELRQLVRIQHMDKPDLPLLAPSQSFFLRENLKLRLLGARLALLSRDQSSYKADVKAAYDWVARYYDAREKSVANVLSTLRTLHQNEISIELPDISSTLDALRKYRASRERLPR